MKLRLALPTLLLSLFPLAGVAQLPSLAPAPQSATPLVDQLLAFDGSAFGGADATPVLPIWSGSDGQLLAVVALPRGWVGSPAATTPGYAGPSGWHLAGNTGSGAGLRWQFGNGFRADAAFGQYGFGSTSPCAGDACSAWAPASMTGLLGLGWTSPGAGLDFSYGLSWLETSQAPATASAWRRPASGHSWLPALAIPGTSGYSVDSEAAVYARGSWHIDQGKALDIGASFGRSRLVSPGPFNVVAPGLDLDQLSLSLGLAAGSLRGAVVGHVTRSDDPALAGKRWTALDLGISWRTPWSGELSLGAQNLWSAPGKTPREADTQGRTPYIQYRQDL